MKLAKLLTPLALISLSTVAVAHDPLPPNWCDDPRSQPVIIENFSFNEEELKALSKIYFHQNPRRQSSSLRGYEPQTMECGIVDEISNWHSAMHVSIGYCAELVGSNEGKAIVLGPGTYTSEDHHHDYRFSDGLKGSCVVCPEPRVRETDEASEQAEQATPK